MQTECDAAIEDIVNEGIVANLNDIPVNIDLTNLPYPEKIKRRIRAEFEEVLRLLNFNENHSQCSKLEQKEIIFQHN